MEKLLSIIIPIYNTGPELFERCLKSILESINVSREIIVIDDGSTGSRSKKYKRICDAYQADYFYQKNKGVSSARNKGIYHARGTFIMFVDADDRMIKVDYSGWIHWMIENHIDVLSGCICMVFANGTMEKKDIHADGLLFTYKNEDLIQLILTRGHCDHPELKDVKIAGPCCKLIRKAAIAGLSFPSDIQIGEDMVFNLALLKRDIRYAIANELWYEYHIYADSAMNRFSHGLEERYYAAIERIGNMDLTDKEEGYLAHRALYHYVRMLKIYVSNGDIKAKEFIRFINTMEHKKEWNGHWKKIRIDKCNLGNKYKLILLLIKSRQDRLLYQLIRIAINKKKKQEIGDKSK